MSILISAMNIATHLAAIVPMEGIFQWITKTSNSGMAAVRAVGGLAILVFMIVGMVKGHFKMPVVVGALITGGIATWALVHYTSVADKVGETWNGNGTIYVKPLQAPHHIDLNKITVPHR